MNIQIQSVLIGALTGALVTVFGWLVNHHFSRKREDEARRREAALRYLERQMEELYGPLWGFVQQSRIIYDVACKRLPTASSGRIDLTRFSGQDTVTWHYLMETWFLPTNAQMADLIRTKIYLIDSGDIPASFRDFMSHQAQLEVLHLLWKKHGIDSTNVIGIGWPLHFDSEVSETLERLKKKYQVYLQSSRLEISQDKE